MQYVVVYEQSPNNWGAYVPDLPGCVAVADTKEETRTLIREAIEFYLEALAEDNEPIPQPGAWAELVDVAVPAAPAGRARPRLPAPPRRERSLVRRHARAGGAAPGRYRCGRRVNN